MRPQPTASSDRAIADLVFVAFNRRVVALDRFTGERVWDWKAPSGTGYVSVLLDDDRLVAAVNGYVYCLDPLYGQVVWENPLKGLGNGVASLASVNGSTPAGLLAEAAAAAARAAAAAAGAGA